MALPSPSSAVRDSPLCWRCRGQTELPLCQKCHAIQALPEGLTAFSILGTEPRLSLDDGTLHAAYLARSRSVHPDRFANTPSPEPEYALQWSTALNRANQMLRTRNGRTRYVLDLNGSKPLAKPPVPMELAETYFELQDALQEEGGALNLKRFQTDLLEKQANLSEHWTALAKKFDAEKTVLSMQELEAWLVEQKYLSSMLSDIESRL